MVTQYSDDELLTVREVCSPSLLVDRTQHESQRDVGREHPSFEGQDR